MASLKYFLLVLGFLLVLAAAAIPTPEEIETAAVGEREHGRHLLLVGILRFLPRVIGASGRAAIAKILEVSSESKLWKDFGHGVDAGMNAYDAIISIAKRLCVSSNGGCCGNGSANYTMGSFCTSVCQACHTVRDVYCTPSNQTGLPPSQACTEWDVNYGNWTSCAQVQFPGCLAQN